MTRLVIVTLCSSFPLLADEAVESMARAEIITKGDVWTGQKVSLVVELLAPGYFAGAPSFDLPKVTGCLMVPPSGSPTIGNETRDGQTFTVQRHELMVFPRRPGKVDIPSFEIRFAIKRAPLDHDSVPQSVHTSGVSFKAKTPPGVGANVAVTSADLVVSESWKPEPGKQAKPGDAFVRTIIWSASDLTGMAFPPFPKEAVPGLGIYRSDPVVQDTSDRGQLHGSRVDTITYVCKTGGVISVPPYTIRWWDPVKNRLQTTEFPARTFTVMVPPPPPEAFSRKASRYIRSHLGEIFCVLAGGILVLATFRFWRPPFLEFCRRLRPRHLPPLNPAPPA